MSKVQIGVEGGFLWMLRVTMEISIENRFVLQMM